MNVRVAGARSTSWRETALCAAMTAVIYSQFVALGANTPLLAALGATAELVFGLLVVAVSLGTVSRSYWLRLYLVLGLVLAALTWFLWPRWSPLLPALATAPGWRPALNPDAVTLEAIKLAGAAAMALSSAVLARSRVRAINLTNWLVIGGGGYVVFCLWLWRWDPYSVWGISKGPHGWLFTGSLLSANAAGCVFGMISLLALGLLQSMSRSLDLHAPRLRELLLFGAAGFGVIGALAAAALTGSRTSLLLTALLTAVLAAADLARIRDGSKLPRVIGAAALGVILTAMAAGVGFGPINAKSSLHEEFGSRMAAYRDYLRAAAAAPVSGYGPGAFPLVNAATLPSGRMDDRWSYIAARCAPLQAALEGGLPFLLLLAVALAVTVIQIVHAWLARKAASAASIAALAAGLLAFGCSLVDIALNVPALAAFAATVMGLAWGASAGLDAPRARSAKPQGWGRPAA